MKYPITHYKTLVFDCDGVVLDSNKIKTEAFYYATLSYGEAAARAMVEYHVSNGGVSRYKKFGHFLEEIAPKHMQKRHVTSLETLLERYANRVREGLLSCDVAPGLATLRQKTRDARWLIVSGGDQSELRHVFAKRGMTELFDGGIFGSPETKEEIMAREVAAGTIQKPALFLGDSRYDYEAANAFDLDFVFLSEWSEVDDWQTWVAVEKLTHARNVQALEYIDQSSAYRAKDP